MKRIIALTLAALLLCSAASALAEEYYNIVELRQYTPERLTKFYETKWRTVEIDAPILLPSVDKLPALVLRRMPMPDITLDDGAVSVWPASNYAEYLIEMNQEHTFAMLPKGTHASRQEWNKRQAENNDLTPEEATEIAKQLFRRYTLLDLENDVTWPDQPTARGAYYQFDYQTGRSNGIPLEPSETAVHKGSYEFVFEQKFRHAVFYGPGTSYTKSAVKSNEPVAEGSSGYISVTDREHYTVKIDHYLEEAELLAEDIPLVSFDVVLQAIEPYILGGNIRSIESIRLCDLCSYVPPEGDDDVFWAVPCWTVRGYWKDSPTDEITAYDYPDHTLYINAQTGKAYDPFDRSVDRNRLKQLITWDQLQ